MDLTTYPARLVISRGPTPENPAPFVTVDDKALHNAGEMADRLLYYERYALAYRTPFYTYTPSPEAEAAATAERIRAELETQHKPDPTQADPLDAALTKARAAFEGDKAALARLEKAAELVKAGAVKDLGGGQWEVIGQSGRAYHVNGACQCEDYAHRAGWCKHRLAVALVRRAELLKNGTGSAANTPGPEPAPEGTDTQGQNTTPPGPVQIELVVVYETDDANFLPRTGAAELLSFKADGRAAQPPTRDLNALYRWMGERGYIPAGRMWLGRAIGGKRQRRQVYALAGA
jgi:hypothetical protein